MVDFDKLSAMINEVNNVINDVERETISTNKAIEKTEEKIVAVMWKDLKSYFELINKCTYLNVWVMSFHEADIVFKFKYDCGNLAFGTTKDFIIIDGHDKYVYNIGLLGDSEYIYSRLKSCNTISKLVKIAREWDSKYKDIFDEQIAKYAESLLKEKAEIAHTKYNAAKENAAKYEI